MGMAADAFWHLSLVEWQAIAEGLAMRAAPQGPIEPFVRASLEALMTRFPDIVKDTHHGR